MKKILIFLTVLICMSFSCVQEESDTFHRKVKVTNNADYVVYVTYDYFKQEEPEYPWYQNEKMGVGIGESGNRVQPGQTNVTAISTYGSNSIEGMMGKRKMKVFFVDAAAFDRIPIGDLLPDELLLDSRVYDIEDLRAINFHIYYPLE